MEAIPSQIALMFKQLTGAVRSEVPLLPSLTPKSSPMYTHCVGAGGCAANIKKFIIMYPNGKKKQNRKEHGAQRKESSFLNALVSEPNREFSSNFPWCVYRDGAQACLNESTTKVWKLTAGMLFSARAVVGTSEGK